MEHDDLLRLISDGFGPKAESIDEKCFHLYFENRPSILAMMKEQKHQVVLGRRGTGKTMLMKYFDLATLVSAPGQEDDIPVIGFYTNMGKFAVCNIELLPQTLLSAVRLMYAFPQVYGEAYKNREPGDNFSYPLY